MIAVTPAIANAIYDAVGVHVTDMPATPEKILSAINAKHTASY
jgi:CO/xanthine dehydrogenase Mo-binding subunit